MKKLLVAVFIVMLFMFSEISYSACGGDYDYAELKDMSQEELLKTFCENRESTKKVATMSLYSRRYEREAKACMDVTDKIERAYLKRFKIDRDTLIKMCDPK